MDKEVQQRRQWTKSDNSLLEEAVQKFGFKWQQVANYLETRTPSQCCQRWKRMKKKISKQKRKSVNWTKEDTNQLKKYIREYGKNWQLIAEMLQNKSRRQVRDKYLNSIDPKIQKEPWTKEEDDILYQNFLIHGNKWTLIKTKLPSRSERMVKNRFYNHIRYTHLGLQNHYKLIKNQTDPQQEIQRHRQQVIESLKAISTLDSMQQTDEFQKEDLDQFLNLEDDFYNYNTIDI